MWASHYEELCSDGVVAPPVFAPLVGPALGVVLDRCNPPEAAVDADLDAAAQARRAARTVEGGVVYVPQALHGSPSASRIHAQRVARCDHCCTHNCLPPQK